jgi:hypothetical protein
MKTVERIVKDYMGYIANRNVLEVVCGDSKMLIKIAEKACTYVTPNDPNARNMAINEPGLFLQRYEPLVIIDEI